VIVAALQTLLLRELPQSTAEPADAGTTGAQES